jgi:hypothetical protein
MQGKIAYKAARNVPEKDACWILLTQTLCQHKSTLLYAIKMKLYAMLDALSIAQTAAS